MGLWTVTTVGLFYFIMCEDPCDRNSIQIHWNSIWLRARLQMTSHYTWGSEITLQHDFGSVLGRPLDTFFWAQKLMVMALGSCVKWPLVTCEQLSLRNNRLKFETSRKLPIIWRNIWNIPQSKNKLKPERSQHVSVWLGNARILIDYAQKSPRTLL